MADQPHCLWCQKKIRKRTTTLMFGEPEAHKRLDGPWMKHLPEKPRSITVVEKMTNQKVVAVRWSDRGGWITHAFVWDGVSYVDKYFCNGNHASYFAYACARSGLRRAHLREPVDG